MIISIATLLGEPLLNKAGRSRIGKHTWRAMAAILMGEVGVDVYKIRMVGRWNCSVVIYYTRDAPITDMASGFVQAKAARENLKQAGRFDTSLYKIKTVVETTVQGMQDEIKALIAKVLLVEKRAIPDYVANRNTRNIHRILSAYSDAGQEALANCGFVYAKPGACTKFISVALDDVTWD